jgi:hypothetical protein
MHLAGATLSMAVLGPWGRPAFAGIRGRSSTNNAAMKTNLRSQYGSLLVCAAAEEDDASADAETAAPGDSAESSAPTGSAFSGRRRRSRRREPVKPVSLDDFNPIALGRKSRQAFDSVIAEDGENLTLDDLNPISMGRRSRKVFDDVWSQLQKIGGPSRSSVDYGDDLLPEVFDAVQAEDSTVLVVGATGRVGRVLVRKLLIRGYRVKALVRRRGEASEQSEDVLESIPQVRC